MSLVNPAFMMHVLFFPFCRGGNACEQLTMRIQSQEGQVLPGMKPCMPSNKGRVGASLDPRLFQMQSAPLLIPPGDWEESEGSITAPEGFEASGVYAGMRSGKKADLALVVCKEGAIGAGTFTQNVMCAAPVTVCKEVLAANGENIKAVRISCPAHLCPCLEP